MAKGTCCTYTIIQSDFNKYTNIKRWKLQSMCTTLVISGDTNRSLKRTKITNKTRKTHTFTSHNTSQQCYSKNKFEETDNV